MCSPWFPMCSPWFPWFSHGFGPVVEELLANVLLSGGGSLFRGLPERLQRELAAMRPASDSGRSRVEVVAPDTRLGMD